MPTFGVVMGDVYSLVLEVSISPKETVPYMLAQATRDDILRAARRKFNFESNYEDSNVAVISSSRRSSHCEPQNSTRQRHTPLAMNNSHRKTISKAHLSSPISFQKVILSSSLHHVIFHLTDKINSKLASATSSTNNTTRLNQQGTFSKRQM
jgi:hypothetical protein